MIIIKDDQPRMYELTYLVPAVFTQSEIDKMREEIATLVKKFKGEVVQSYDWGKKPLAYSIRYNSKDVNEAVYTHLEFTLLPEQAPEFEKQVYLMSNLIRHLLVKVDDKKKTADEPKATS